MAEGHRSSGTGVGTDVIVGAMKGQQQAAAAQQQKTDAKKRSQPKTAPRLHQTAQDLLPCQFIPVSFIIK